jgi:uncharacterized protein
VSERARLVSRVVGLATAHPVKVIVGVLLLTALAVLVFRRLELGGSIYDLFPRRPGPVADLALYMRVFGAQEELVGLVTGPDAESVERATREAAAELQRWPSLRQVRAGVEARAMAELLGPSLLLLADDESWPAVRQRLTSSLREQVGRLRRILLAPVAPDRSLLVRDPLLLGAIVLHGLEAGVSQQSGLYASADGKAAMLFAQATRPSSDSAFCAELQRRLRQLVARLAAGSGIEAQFTGAHLYAYHVSEALQRDLAVSSVLALLGVALVQLIFFRSLRLIPLSALVAGVALCGTLAVATLTVGHLNALSLAFAALFIGMSDDVLIHITAQTRRHLDERPGPRLVGAVTRVAPALLAATLTTVAAFLSFTLSAFAGLGHTGLLAACGLALNLVLAMIFFPALGTVLPPGPGPSGETRVDRVLEGLGGAAQRHRVAVVGVALLLGAGAAWAARELRFSEDLTRLAPAQIPPARTDRAIAARFERARDRVIVMLQGRDAEETLQANDRLAARLAQLRRDGVVASYRSLSSLLPARSTQEARLARLAALGPDDVARRLRAALEAEGLRAEAFAPFFEALTHPRPLRVSDLPGALQPLVGRQLAQVGGDTAVATVLYPRRGADTEQIVAALGALATPGSSVQLRITGATVAGTQMARLLRRDLVTISLTTLGAVLVLLGLFVRRLWPVVATLLSLLLAGVLFAGCLRLLRLELDLYNLMVIPIIIGYGINDHLYLMHRALDEGITASVVESGRPVIAATLTTIVAFAALGFCQVPGLRTLGLTGVLGLGLGMLSSLVVMPALLTLSPRYRGGQ